MPTPWQTVFASWDAIDLTENHVRQLHRDLPKYFTKDERHRGEYKILPSEVAAFDTDGKNISDTLQSLNWRLSMTPTITAFANSPDRGRGLARDVRVRWALEEVGQPYDVRLVSFSEMKEPAHLALHPFGQIPTYEEGDLALFESGAIVFHIAERHTGLLPEDVKARARAITWMFAALNTVEPPLVERGMAMLFDRDKPWYEQRLPVLEDRARKTLGELSNYLGDAEWLEGGAFTAGDLLMVGVLFRSKPSGILEKYPNLAAYVARGEARPAFKRAFAAQLAVFNASQRTTDKA